MGIFNPDVIPLLIVPIDKIPVSAGAKVTVAPGTSVKVLSGTLDA